MTTTKNTVPPSTARDGDALATLGAQHVELLRWCARIESTAEGARGFCDALLAHLAFEDEVVNPAARRALASPLLYDLEVEHETRFIHPRIAQKLVSGKDARVATSGSDRRANDEPAPSRTFYDRSADIDCDWGRIADG